MAQSRPPSRAAIAYVRGLAERELSREEFESYVNAPMTAGEREQIVELIEWFRRRYPTPAERLAYARRAYARWNRGVPE